MKYVNYYFLFVQINVVYTYNYCHLTNKDININIYKYKYINTISFACILDKDVLPLSMDDAGTCTYRWSRIKTDYVHISHY